MNPSAYERAIRRIDKEFDIPQSDVSRLVRLISASGGHLATDKRDRFGNLPDAVLQRIEVIVCEVFCIGTGKD